MRIASKVYTLPKQNRDQVIYTYQKVFKYLAEVLEDIEFNKVSFYNVNRLLERIYETKFDEQNEAKVTLRQFLHQSLDLNYLKSDPSNALLHPREGIQAHKAKQLWHSCADFDIGLIYKTASLKRKELKTRSEQKKVMQLQEYIEDKHAVKRIQEA